SQLRNLLPNLFVGQAKRAAQGADAAGPHADHLRAVATEMRPTGRTDVGRREVRMILTLGVNNRGYYLRVKMGLHVDRETVARATAVLERRRGIGRCRRRRDFARGGVLVGKGAAQGRRVARFDPV